MKAGSVSGSGSETENRLQTCSGFGRKARSNRHISWGVKSQPSRTGTRCDNCLNMGMTHSFSLVQRDSREWVMPGLPASSGHQT